MLVRKVWFSVPVVGLLEIQHGKILPDETPNRVLKKRGERLQDRDGKYRIKS